MNYRTIAIALGILVIAGLLVPTRTVVQVNERSLSVHVASTPVERYRGLSPFESLKSNEGMLFVFDREQDVGFVMRRMDFPIDMAFVGSDLTINRIVRRAQPSSEQTYRARARYVLEASAGWFEGVKAGAPIRIGMCSVLTCYPATDWWLFYGTS